MKRYQITDSGLANKIIEADSLKHALTLAISWVRESTLPDNEHVLRCSASAVEVDDDGQTRGEFAHHFAIVYPNHGELIRRAGGDPSCYHWVDLRDSGDGGVRARAGITWSSERDEAPAWQGASEQPPEHTRRYVRRQHSEQRRQAGWIVPRSDQVISARALREYSFGGW